MPGISSRGVRGMIKRPLKRVGSLAIFGLEESQKNPPQRVGKVF
jgi:hypothetical protein